MKILNIILFVAFIAFSTHQTHAQELRKNGSSVGSAPGVRKEYAAVLFFFNFF
jgi:hypothetical protein